MKSCLYDMYFPCCEECKDCIRAEKGNLYEDFTFDYEREEELIEKSEEE